MAKGKGKPCGATYISRSKVCRVSMHPDLDKAMNAASGNIGARTLQEAVRAHGQGPMKEHHRIKNELRAEVGGNIVKGPKADEFRRRLREAGLLPGGKEEGTSRREISLDREEQAKAYRDMGMKTKDAVAQAKSDIPSEESSPVPADKKASRDIFSKAHSDVERLLRGETPIHEEFKFKSSEKSQMAQLQSVLGLGSLTRQEVGRDYSGLIQEAKNLKSNLQAEIKKAEKNGDFAKIPKLNQRLIDVEKAIKGPTLTAPSDTRWAREEARDADNRMKGEKLTRVGSKSYDNWEDSYAPGSRMLGQGSYGTAILSPDGKTVVKRGDIATTEAGILDKVGKSDLGPRLLAADIDGEPYVQMSGVEMKNGRIAMGVVPGKEMGRDADINTRYGPNKISAPDVYWKAMAGLHRLGIAHNDAHIDNILVDDKGKGRWVDLGAAQASPKAALAEAMGIFSPLKGGDSITVPAGATGRGNWQTANWNGTGVEAMRAAKSAGGEVWEKFKSEHPVASRVWDNQISAVSELKKMGLDVNDINSIIAHGIRSTPESYGKSDGFSILTDTQAQKILNILYEGV